MVNTANNYINGQQEKNHPSGRHFPQCIKLIIMWKLFYGLILSTLHLHCLNAYPQLSSASLLSEEDGNHTRHRRTIHNLEYKDKIKLYYTTLEWIDGVLELHNKLRKRHQSRPLELDYKLSYEAQKWAFELTAMSYAADAIVLRHGNAPGVGENIAAKEDKNFEKLMNIKPGFAVKAWYKEIKNHNWEQNFFQWNAGHFTQVIWGATKRLGCGKAVSENNILFIVCRYYPPGNYLVKGAYKSHVRPPNDGLDFNAIPDYNSL